MVIGHTIAILAICLGPTAMAQLVIGEVVPTVVLDKKKADWWGTAPRAAPHLTAKCIFSCTSTLTR